MLEIYQISCFIFQWPLLYRIIMVTTIIRKSENWSTPNNCCINIFWALSELHWLEYCLHNNCLINRMHYCIILSVLVYNILVHTYFYHLTQVTINFMKTDFLIKQNATSFLLFSTISRMFNKFPLHTRLRKKYLIVLLTSTSALVLA